MCTHTVCELFLCEPADSDPSRLDLQAHLHCSDRAAGFLVIALSLIAGSRIESQEIIRVPHRQDYVAHGFADSFCDHKISTAQDGRTHQHPTHSIGTVFIVHLHRVWIVAQALLALRPSLPSTIPWQIQFKNAGLSNSPVARACIT